MKQPIIYERLEGAAILLGSLYFYFHLHFSLLWFIVLLLVFDVSAVGYLVNNRVGAHAYNLVHSLIGPPILLAIGAATGNRLAIGFALIWLAHIGMDRAFGYGLKFASGFRDTHLGPIGRR